MKYIKRLALLLGLIMGLSACLCPLAAQAAQEEDAGWQLTLVNPWNAVPADWKVTLEKTENGHRVDQRCAGDLADMLAACREAGHSPLIRSSYRTLATQQTLYNNKVAQMKQLGYQGQAALDKAGAIVARPGTSEHQLGLAVDLVDRSYQVLDTKQETTPAQKWLMEHSWEYGFILRYPSEKSEITGIIYEPWHYRYVGKENAKAIYESGLCLEEYLDHLEQERLAAQKAAEEKAAAEKAIAQQTAAAEQSAAGTRAQLPALTAEQEQYWLELLRRVYTLLTGEDSAGMTWSQLTEKGEALFAR